METKEQEMKTSCNTADENFQMPYRTPIDLPVIVYSDSRHKTAVEAAHR